MNYEERKAWASMLGAIQEEEATMTEQKPRMNATLAGILGLVGIILLIAALAFTGSLITAFGILITVTTIGGPALGFWQAWLIGVGAYLAMFGLTIFPRLGKLAGR